MGVLLGRGSSSGSVRGVLDGDIVGVGVGVASKVVVEVVVGVGVINSTSLGHISVNNNTDGESKSVGAKSGMSIDPPGLSLITYVLPHCNWVN